MNIVHLSQYFQPKLGYNDLYIPIKQQMMGHKVCIVTSDRYAPHAKFFGDVIKNRVVGSGTFYEEGLLIYRLPCWLEFGSIALTLGITKVLKEINPDVVHCHDIFSFSLIEAAFNKQSIGFSLVVDSITGTFQPAGITKIAFLAHKYSLFPFLRKKVDFFPAINHGSQKWLQKNMKIMPNPFSLIPLGADMDLFVRNSSKRTEIRKSLGLLEDDILVVYSGKILPEKDIKELILAISSLNKTSKKVHLLIVGSGPEFYVKEISRTVSEHHLSGRVHFHSPVHRTILPEFYSGADIGVWPGSPSNSIIEAMSTSLPVIIAGYGIMRDDAYDTSHLLEYGNGLSFSRGDIEGLAKCIEKLAENEALRSDMGVKSRRLVEDKLNWETIARKYLEVYQFLRQKRLTKYLQH